jgi:glycosyltransferase involved in cell wall biosynthesis
LPHGQRVVYVYVDHTVSCPTNTGVQRVTRGIATGLLAQNERVRFVKWDSAAKRCVFVSREERRYLADWNGPAVDPTEWQFYYPAAEPPALVPAHPIEENNWLIVPEVTCITPHSQPVTLDLIGWSRRYGLRNGFVFYDAIPLRRDELTGMAPAHRLYMQHLRLADVIWPISEWSQADLLAYWAIAERATATTMPEVATFPLPGQGVGERATESRDGERDILCVGTIEPRKNQLGLVRAFQSYWKRNPNCKWTLTLAGNLHPDVAKELHQATRDDNAIRYLGHISDEKLAALYQTCAFTAFPSVEEGFGLPILESLWYAKPCLCANFGSMAEVAAGGGCLAVDVSDPETLLAALKRMIESSDLRQRLSDEAAHRKMHTWEEYTARISARIDEQADAIGRLGPIYYWVDATVSFPKNTGIQRVNRQLARALMEGGAKLVPVKWDIERGEFVRPEIHELEHLAKWNGPGITQWAKDTPSRQEGDGGWFLMTELPLNLSTATQLQFLSYARSLGLKSAAVFFDAIPWKMRDIYPQHYSRVHEEYMEVISQYDLVLPISEFSANDLTSFLSAKLSGPQTAQDYIRATPLPAEFSESERVTTTSCPPHGENPVTILCVGTVEPRKNHLGMVEAFSLATQNSPVPLKLIIAGREDCTKIADGLNAYISEYPSIIWEKDADDKRLRQLYEECDFTIYPSVEEGFGLPILESLWYAKPCICANFGAMVENAKDGGCLTVDVRDSEAFATAIVEMAKPEVRSRLTEEATKLKFKSWKDYAVEVAWHLTGSALPKPAEPLLTANEISARARCMQLEERPKLSVCISTYNRADWLAVNLKNWSAQCPTPIEGVEFLVCDNASTDHTPEVVKPYLARADFSYKRNPVNVGMLGNLRETANYATGEYIWIIGDDDLIVPEAIDRILETISANPDTSLIYLNYAFTRIKDARTISDFDSFFANATPIVPAEPDITGPIKTICARNENFFTAIYTLVFRRDHAINAYSQNTDGRPFSTMLTAIPTTYYVLNHMMEENGVWLGTPQIVVNMNVSWTKYIPLWILERIPEVYDLAERRGAPKTEIDSWRRHTLPSVAHYFDEIFQDQHEENARYLNPARLVHRFKHLPEFHSIQPQLQITYETARQHGHFAAKTPTSQIFTQFDEHY